MSRSRGQKKGAIGPLSLLLNKELFDKTAIN
jgi:hypothetical protein